MNQSDLPHIRLLVKNQAFTLSDHAQQQMLSRNIEYDDVESVLTSPTNQVIESQAPSTTPGREHSDERFLVYDPQYGKEIIVVCVLIVNSGQIPDIRIVTVEHVDPQKWKKQMGNIPSLARIK